MFLWLVFVTGFTSSKCFNLTVMYINIYIFFCTNTNFMRIYICKILNGIKMEYIFLAIVVIVEGIFNTVFKLAIIENFTEFGRAHTQLQTRKGIAKQVLSDK